MADIAADDPIGAQLDTSSGNAEAEEQVLASLAAGSVLVLLARSPGEGEARPERNLVEWRNQTDDVTFVPLFTAAARLPGMLPAPNVLVRVPTRILLSLAGRRYYVLNPLSTARLILPPSRIDDLRALIRARSGETSAPSRQVPWGFRLPSDDWYPIAHALATWIDRDGRLDTAYLYELLRGEEEPQVVLGLAVPTDPALATTLRDVTEEAGAIPGSLTIRFLPDEPSHAQGVESMGLTPFYQRPSELH